MNVKPILFSGPMVRALLDGRKTETRRVLKPQPFMATLAPGERFVSTEEFQINCREGRLKKVPGVGSLLWVRETWGCPAADHPSCSKQQGYRKPRHDDRIVYLANDADAAQWDRPGAPGVADFCWRPCIHMPRWASRITLEVTDVRVQRVQDISEEDARAEGMPEPYLGDNDPPHEEMATMIDRRRQFRNLWNTLNAKRGFGWDGNPWVVALTCTVHACNVDRMAEAA